ncbi:putative leucine-rich repeat protein (LRRP) [Trypanosoma theileri]|uniref:Putative leucine-rich repeat protein (LRRP) n=1 Tax=Trypanosoma theileri TaxID=67003 RepID=A0A1X0P5U4_9TRYP|nr:putative leucine-rich repeat protein (LRRP) [Trypanosoma theileri]ORC92297.1 putative leucine-rich repeat protein (LRRP) [Trypanosoma theileri]
MELSLCRRGLQSFDATTLLLEATDKPQQGKNAPLRENYIPVRALDLSHNNITSFAGREALWCLTVLDLSNNSLNSLDATSLPSCLARLKISNNELQSLRGLASAVPKLQELDVSFNRITSSGIGDLPKTLSTLILQGNLIDSVSPLLTLQHLSNLDLSSNRIVDIKELRRLGVLRALRYLELHGNPVMENSDTVPLLLEAVPKLIRLDRKPLSQAGENQMFKVNRSRSAKKNSGESQRKRINEPLSHRSSTVRQSNKSDTDMETRLLEVRVKELTRLVMSAEKAEQQLRYQKKILQEQISACAGVIESQAMELERLESKINELKSEETALKEPAAELEQTFEQTHASLVAHRLNQSSACL